MQYSADDIYLIYAGGTFGSHGSPLAPLANETFLPILTTWLRQHTPYHTHILSNSIIKDSSTLNPQDFFHFYQIIYTAYQNGAKKFTLITGTDTLSFLSAFLAHALNLHDISLVITGSMTPLLATSKQDYIPNPNSDAWHNLLGAINHCQQYRGVFVYFDKKSFWAGNTQKIHSQNLNAFVGTDILPTSSHTGTLPINTSRIDKAKITALYLLPNTAETLSHQLYSIHADTTAVILIAFGSGNLIKTDTVIAALEYLHQQNTVIVCTTMCPFGGVDSTYLAGSWQYTYHVWSGKDLSIAGIYGKLLWHYLTDTLTFEYWHA